MDKLITIQQAQVLTPKGFFRHYKSILPGKTREQAYNQTEALHRQIDEDGENKYGDFESFIQMAKRFERQNKAAVRH